MSPTAPRRLRRTSWSGQCSFGGEIITAAAGYFGSAAMMEGEGIRLPATDAAPTLAERGGADGRDPQA